MTRAEYEAEVCARRHQACHVPFVEVAIGEWVPKVSDCHNNVDRYVAARPGYAAVRGWVTYASFGGDSVGFTAHSVVRDRCGQLFDITPLGDETARTGMNFLEHEGDQDTFFAIKAICINIHCVDFENFDSQSLMTNMCELSEEEE